ncbi:MAG: GNAT family N-acetyltransferase [Candidatus Marinimicrobia bacterium]|nr:GNAT family N-acetyltransferase [Candidatus Neomarinimicrobiota bacterium]
MEIVTYQPEQDEKAVMRIFKEVGWVENKEQEKGARIYFNGQRALIAKINGEAECFAGTMPGVIKYLNKDLSFTAVTGVVTSRIARKQGLAGKLTARVIARDVAEGALVAGLGIFEQGYYNRLGFGSGVYENWINFDPANLVVDRQVRTPRRLTADNYKEIQQALEKRRRGHGSISITQINSIQAELHWIKDGFGLGYYDGENGELSHFIWCKADGESGPYEVVIYAFREAEQFLDLMALIKSFGDQIRMVRMREPAGIQVQDLIRQPFRWRQLTQKNKFENINRATAYYQIRICDLIGCLQKTHLPFGEAQFNLKLSDPISKYLDDSIPWQGVAGDYIVTLGKVSNAHPGSNPDLPTLIASVGAFTRLWMGVRPASGLAITDNLKAPQELIMELDVLLRLPEPKPEWDF